MVTEVKGELARLVVSSTSARRAEVVSLLRVTEALHVVSNHVYIEAVVDLATIAARLSKDIHGLYGYRAAVHSRSPNATPPRALTSCGSIKAPWHWPVKVAYWTPVAARYAGFPPR